MKEKQRRGKRPSNKKNKGEVIMANANSKSRGTIFTISLKERPDFKDDLRAFVFDSVGNLLSQAPIKGSKVEIDLPPEKIARTRLFIAPTTEKLETSPTIKSMERLNAYEALVAFEGTVIGEIVVPGVIVDGWPQCGCLIRGKVVRSSDNRGVCGARIHICEVERIPRWIFRLPEEDVYQLRDDLIAIIRNPPIPIPDPVGPVIDSGPFPPGPRPDPVPATRPLYRFKATAPKAAPSAVLPQSMFSAKALGPQPIPPGVTGQLMALPASLVELEAKLYYPNSIGELQGVLVDNWKTVGMLLCQMQEWWWRLRCDEVTVVTTDDNGRFEANLSYPCVEDRPHYYFSVEYEFEGGFETVYEPSMACNTHWNYPCGSEVTLPVADPRIPGCTTGVDLPGCQVVVLSIGREVAVQEIQTKGENEGLTTTDEPFGGTLEPRADFSRTALRAKGVKFYRWSYRRLSGPDGVSTTAPGSSPPVSTASNAMSAPASDWTPLIRDVYRHYTTGTSYPSYLVGPLPTENAERTAPKENLFEIHPADPPTGHWRVLNEHVDLAEAYFETASLPDSPERGPTEELGRAPDDLAAGRYELKLELFDKVGDLVDWAATDKNIDLCIAADDAPFGTEDIGKKSAPNDNQLTIEGESGLWGFKMVVRVDNNHCYAEVLPLAGDVEPDPECGFHTYESGYDVHLGFIARHPNHFANFGFNTSRATSPSLSTTSGVAGESATNSYTHVDFEYTKEVAVTDLLHIEDGESCANAAFGEHLDVSPMAQNGYGKLRHLHHEDTAAFALAQPCGGEDVNL